jgi:DivIVA domain-containing protein
MTESTISARDIRDYRFNTTRFRPGYAIDQVDNFLDAAVANLDAYEDGTTPFQPLQPSEILAHSFKTVRFMEGYDIDAVDELLTRIAHALDLWQRGEAAPRQSTEPSTGSSNPMGSAETKPRKAPNFPTPFD